MRNAVHGERASRGGAPAPGGTAVISKLACSLVGQAHEVQILPGTRAGRAYGVERAIEQFRCSYGLNPLFREAFVAGPLQVTGIDAQDEVRIVELPDHPFYVATLFLPQLNSIAGAPHPLIVAYLEAARAARRTKSCVL
jgi:CTP synthase (UTP-ammonia lyase)